MWRVPAALLDDGAEDTQVFALPLLSSGGALFAVPEKVLSADMLLDSMMREEAGLVGPSREFTAQLMVKEEIGSGVVDLDTVAVFVAVDLEESALADMREYDPVTDSTESIVPYSLAEPNALPKVNAVLPLVL